MYNMRYHLASLISVFLALAIGVLLGGLISEQTPENLHETLIEGIERDMAQLREQNAVLSSENELIVEFSDMLAENFIEDRLEGRTILVLGDDENIVEMAIADLESAGAATVYYVPEFDSEAGVWGLLESPSLEALEFHGIVNTFEPAGEGGEYLSEYFIYLREVQEFYNLPLIFATTESDEGEVDMLNYAWEEGFSGTNQLDTRFSAYSLIVLLISDTEGKFGTMEEALALWPPVPTEFLPLSNEELSEEDTPTAE